MRQILLLASAAALMSGIAARANDTGFAYGHDLRKEGGRLCMSDHYHSGSGAGKTKAAALAAAARSWADFTNFEYGSAWARWSLARGKDVRYTKEAAGYSADIDARPCKG